MPTKKNRISGRLDKEIRKSLTRLIDQRTKMNRVVSEECPQDLLQHMIKASFSSRNAITIQDIVEECKSIFFAGKDTMSNLMTWTTVLEHISWLLQLFMFSVLRIFSLYQLGSKFSFCQFLFPFVAGISTKFTPLLHFKT